MNNTFSVGLEKYNGLSLINALRLLADKIDDFAYGWCTTINAGGINRGIFLNINIDEKEIEICNQPRYNAKGENTMDDVLLNLCAMDPDQFEKLKSFIKQLMDKWSIEDLLAEVYNLYQENIIGQRQEEELYRIIDPNNKSDKGSAELWYDSHGCVELWEYVQ